VTIANLQAARDDLTAKMAAAQTGGPADTAAKNNSRQTLIGMLRDVAAYVQIRCNDDPAILLSSGFEMHYRILDHPFGYQDLRFGIRRVLTHRFPYAIYFAVEGETIVIVAVLSTARDPEEWQRRV